MLERCKTHSGKKKKKENQVEEEEKNHDGFKQKLQKKKCEEKHTPGIPEFTRRGSVLYRVNTNSVRPLYLYITQWSACINTCL